jgi:hypothetical protein
MSETFQPSLYQTECHEQTPDGEKPARQAPEAFPNRAVRTLPGPLAALRGFFINSTTLTRTPQTTLNGPTPAAAGAPIAELSEADAGSLLRSHRIEGSDLLPFPDSTANQPAVVRTTPRRPSLWARCRHAITSRMRPLRART